ncbi:MAG: hypothetical protein AAFX85_04695 [Pseudomonadota bacterium]
MMNFKFGAGLALFLLTAASASAQSVVEKIESLTTNAGLYGNQIPSGSFPRPYTEICVVGGAIRNDQNPAGADTDSGNCRPGFAGWVIEQDERVAQTWTEARMDCLADQMRLPELFEWQFSCFDASAFGLAGMVDNNEWAGNTATPMTNVGTFGAAVPVIGDGSCFTGNWGSAAFSIGNEITLAYRCAR